MITIVSLMCPLLSVPLYLGTNGETNPLSLDKWFHNDFEAGQTDEYHVTAKDVGELLMVTLKSDGGGLYSDWFVNRVTIKDKAKNTTYDFPCNRWVQSESLVFEGAGKIDRLVNLVFSISIY